MSEVRARILEAAHTLYVIGGRNNCTPAGIARITGLSQTVVSRHFSDPDELVYAVIQKSANILCERLFPLLDACQRQLRDRTSVSHILCATFIALISPQRAVDRERIVMTLCRAYLESDGASLARSKLMREYGSHIADFINALAVEEPHNYDRAAHLSRVRAVTTAFANLFVMEFGLGPERQFWNTRSAQLVEQMVRLAMSILRPNASMPAHGAFFHDVLRLIEALPLPHSFYGSINGRLL